MHIKKFFIYFIVVFVICSGSLLSITNNVTSANINSTHFNNEVPLSTLAENSYGKLYNVSFSVSGLPLNFEWDLHLNSINEAANSNENITTSLQNGTYSYYIHIISTIYDYAGNFSINGKAINISTNLSRSPNGKEMYDVNFKASGIPNNTNWGIFILKGSGLGSYTTNELSLNMLFANGTYEYYSFNTVNQIKNYENLTINGKNETINEDFCYNYTITFSQVSSFVLPAGTDWYVNLSSGLSFSSNNTNISFRQPNGTYNFSISTQDKLYIGTTVLSKVYRESVHSFSVFGSNVSLFVYFGYYTYPIYINETGLPPNSTWFLKWLGGATFSYNVSDVLWYGINSTVTTAIFSTDVSGYSSFPNEVTFSINGSSININVTFKRVYNVTFTVSGLPLGQSWWVNLSAYNISSHGSSIDLYLPNGTYLFQTGTSDSLFSDANFSGTLTISGNAVNLSVNFVKKSYDVEFLENGLKPQTKWYLKLSNGFYSGPIKEASLNISLMAGNYSFIASTNNSNIVNASNNFYVGDREIILVNFTYKALLEINVRPINSYIYLNGEKIPMTNGSTKLYILPGSYELNASFPGYLAYHTDFNISSGAIDYYNISLKSDYGYGKLIGNTFPKNITIDANGVVIQVTNGSFSHYLENGTYFLTEYAKGYVTGYNEINISTGFSTYLNISLKPSNSIYYLEGYLRPINASILFNGYSAAVNNEGFYQIYLPAGNYNISVAASGYFSLVKKIDLISNTFLNFTLSSISTPTSSKSFSNVSIMGFNVTIFNASLNQRNISITYNSSINGKLVIFAPYNVLGNVTVSQIENSKVYIDGAPYKDFNISLSENNGNFSVYLTVYNLRGDPVLVWSFNPIPQVNDKGSVNGISLESLVAITSLAMVLIVAIAVAVFLRMKSKRN